MKAYEYIKQNIRNNLKEKMIAWRNSDSIVKLEKPTDIGKARALGYKDKKGIIVFRVRIKRGGRKHPRISKGRRSPRRTIKKFLQMNYRWVAESRAAKKHPNLEVLNSYMVGKDGQHYFFEIIMIDSKSPEIQGDSSLKWMSNPKNKNRVFRGLTSAGKKSRKEN